MLDPNLFLLFMAGAVALNLTPGPDMTFVLAQAMHRGPRAGVAAAFGGGKLAQRLKRNPVIGRILGWISASVMLGLAVRLAWTERR
jgi:threonine/homoserine/homoserine lactone efflux protein